MKPYIPFFLIILLVGSPLFADSTWEGTTTVSRYGEFPDSGNYGASNSFERNTIITVTNMENGQSTTVIIVDRLDDPGLFLLLSRDAAAELGVTQGEMVRVSARLDQPKGSGNVFREDLPYNSDPDINPAAAVAKVPGTTTGALATLDRIAAELEEESGPEVDGATEPTTTEPEAEGDAAEVATADPASEQETAADGAAVAVDPVRDAEPPIVEDAAVDEIADEPTPPVEPIDVAEVSPLSTTGETTGEGETEIAGPPDPPVEGADAPALSGLMPAPILDEEELFVLLAEPDVPDESAFVTPGPTEELLISSLFDPPVMSEDRVAPILPPEPVFTERIAKELGTEEPPEVEDILIVSDLITPVENDNLMAGMPTWIELPLVMYKEADTPVVDLLATPYPADPGSPTRAAVAEPTPPLFIGEEVDDAHIAFIDTPAEQPEIDNRILDISLDEPVFVARDAIPEPPEDILLVSDLIDINRMADAPGSDVSVAMEDVDLPPVVEKVEESKTEVAVVDDSKLIVVNGFEPTVYDSEEFDISLEPAEPRPPEPYLVDSEILAIPEVEEAEEVIEVAAVPEVEEAVVELVPAGTTPPVEVEYSKELAVDAFYLQVGVFAEAAGAKRLQRNLSETYPVTVYMADQAERPIYKVLVGPLNRDESGALLYTFRSLGYTDAFIRKGS